MAICTECDNYRTDVWKWMRTHYKVFHPKVKRVDKLFTKEFRTGKTCHKNAHIHLED